MRYGVTSSIVNFYSVAILNFYFSWSIVFKPKPTFLVVKRKVRIPTQIRHPFRFKPATYSDPIRPGIPKQTGHPLTKVSDAG